MHDPLSLYRLPEARPKYGRWTLVTEEGAIVPDLRTYETEPDSRGRRILLRGRRDREVPEELRRLHRVCAAIRLVRWAWRPEPGEEVVIRRGMRRTVEVVWPAELADAGPAEVLEFLLSLGEDAFLAPSREVCEATRAEVAALKDDVIREYLTALLRRGEQT